MNRISPSGTEFVTPDGARHRTWNIARRHLTRSDLLDTILLSAPAIPGDAARQICDAVLRDWSVSKKSSTT